MSAAQHPQPARPFAEPSIEPEEITLLSAPPPVLRTRTRPQHTVAPERLAALVSACLWIDDARIHGLIDGSIEVHRGRCAETLSELRELGIVPTAAETERAALEILAELGTVRA